MSKVYKCEHNQESEDMDHVKISVHKNKLKFVFNDPIRDIKINIKLKNEEAIQLRDTLMRNLAGENEGRDIKVKDKEIGTLRSMCDGDIKHTILHGQQGIALVSVHLHHCDTKELIDDIGRFLALGEI